MTWATLQAVALATRLEFTRALASLHNFVLLPSGRWCRVLGAPGPGVTHIRGRVWRVDVPSDERRAA